MHKTLRYSRILKTHLMLMSIPPIVPTDRKALMMIMTTLYRKKPEHVSRQWPRVTLAAGLPHLKGRGVRGGRRVSGEEKDGKGGEEEEEESVEAEMEKKEDGRLGRM